VPKKFTLGKKERLKSRKSIEKLFNEGKKIMASPYKVYYVVNNELSVVNKDNALKFGVGVSSKNFKKAVDRNRIKRLTKEAYRLQKNSLQEKAEATNHQLDIFFLYTGKDIPEYDKVYKQVGVLLNKLDKLTGE
jgi:ribonuclease P protein component